MKLHTIFECEECEECGRQSPDRAEIMECEAAHLGLTVAEKQEWDRLKADVRYKGSIVSSTKNETTDMEFDEAIKRVMDFEKEHGIKG